LERIHDLLSDRLPPGRAGCAIVFRATREATVGTAEFLQAKGWRAAYFHAGLIAPEKKRIQDEFLGGETQVICATNAFGMGIDKEDVRLVVHADTPGSLENYLQEAGRAGRDGQIAECVLLYDEEDCEQQFRLGAFSELSRRDIAQILRGLRKAAARGEEGEIVITTGEILRDDDMQANIALEERNADTKVRTAISWLERAGFIQRDENVTQVFQARLLIHTLAEAEAKMAPLKLSANEQSLWLAILSELMNAGPTESLTVDSLALLPQLTNYAQRGPGGANPEFVSAKVLKTLGSMARVGLLKRDTLMNAFVRHKVADHSRLRLTRVLELDRKLVDLLATEEPDPEGWLPLNLRLLNQRLCDELAAGSGAAVPAAIVRQPSRLPSETASETLAGTVAGGTPAPLSSTELVRPRGELNSASGAAVPAAIVRQPSRLLSETASETLAGTVAGGTPAPLSSTELVRALLKSLSEDGRGFAGTHGSIDLRHLAQDTYRVRVRRNWKALSELAEKRRRVAVVVLDVLLSKIPADMPPRADLLVEFSFEELHDALDRDLILRAEIKDMDAAIERGLMYLHEQRVIILQQGLAVFRSAMRIRLSPGAKGDKYKVSDYQPLEDHYHERVLQVHVMSEYARRGLAAIREALSLVLAYFSLGKDEFIRRYLSTKPDLLQHATTAQSFQRIVTDLGNPKQIKIVTAPVGRNMLILAGPGSGKTRVVVHRCAYLLRVERVRPQSVLVCCFNRHAAVELRRRLSDLVGADARGVTVLTYHALAMRLLERTFLPTERSAGLRPGANRALPAGPEAGAPPDFDSLITDAVKLLRGETVPAGLEPDEVRERLLAGFQHILVDEYQDIDAPQYELISALAGRTLDDADQKLSILAVGDDDQNIYTFRGANVEFIRRFAQDYAAEPHYLVENYRSTRCIIEASNQLIAANTDRMKTEHPIRIDRHRAMLPAGGEFSQCDPVARGKVQVIRVPDDLAQASEVITEIRRLRALGVADWSSIAVLSSTHQELAQVRALAEQDGIPVRWWAARSALPPLHQVREVHLFLRHLTEKRSALLRAADLIQSAERMFPTERGNPWVTFLSRALAAWQSESDDAELPVQDALEFLYETCADSRREFSYGDGVTLSTVHAAKGTEHDHVLLIGAWPLKGPRAQQEELRRTFYVGMTRARKSLAVFEHTDARPSLAETLSGPAILRRDATLTARQERQPAPSYAVLSLEDIHLSYAGNLAASHAVHAALTALQPGDTLSLSPQPRGGLGLCDASGTCVARLSRKAEASWSERLASVREIRVLALVRRRAEQDEDSDRRARYAVLEWEIPLVEVVVGHDRLAAAKADRLSC
jgi:superfamily I DNA/RNA helicase